MGKVVLRLSKKADAAAVIELDPLKRKGIIERAIANGECFLIVAEESRVGFIIFNYNFFGRGFIDLIEIKESRRGHGYGGAAIQELFKVCKTERIFTSTNGLLHCKVRQDHNYGTRLINRKI